MTASRCAQCESALPKGRSRYCSDNCSALFKSAKQKATAEARRTPCVTCGGPKDPGPRGRKYCAECRLLQNDALQHLQHERSRQINLAQRAEKVAAGQKLLKRADAPEGQKWCAHCQQFKKLTSFRVRSDTKTGRAAYCHPCQKSYTQSRRWRMIYGITAEEFSALSLFQGDRCAICHEYPRKTALAVDHDHKTGLVRGLLCRRCNHKLLGAAKESQEILRRAADYLDSPPTGLAFKVPHYVPGTGGRDG